ncbi:hypothetical protein M378DRAFT_8678 [Amanita muscaria Koide BX008]|uniref:Uncharacterized protein n=1 Tax=Amanita muscaria (strain Koide BX008) TaxID=946122 RepID=A0A0C2SYN9_AMAMK|nr:hypothetical protein M378DRAFT_8678 [Amanita muscaria Koide BX008]
MIHLYQVAPEPALRYAATLFVAISDIKVNVNNECRAMWEDTQESLLSGILDFLEQHPTTDKQTLVASVYYSPLCRELFPEEDKPNPVMKDSLLCTIFQLLSETAIFHPENQHNLRSSDVLGGKRLGVMLAQCRDFLVIEALLELFGNIIPSAKVPKKRAEFIDDVFSPVRLKCGAKLLENASPTGWDIVSTTVCDALAKSDIQYPQPFETAGIQAGNVSYTVSRIYIDKSAFMASVDKVKSFLLNMNPGLLNEKDGQLDTFKVPFCTVRRIKVLASSTSTNTVMIVAGAPPLLGHVFSMHRKDEETSIAFDLQKDKIADFVTVLRQRGLKNVIEPIHRKQSKAKTSVNLGFRSGNMEFPPLEEKIENLSRLWQSHRSPTEIDPNGTTSPLLKILEAKDEGGDGGIGTLPTEFDGSVVRISLSTTDEKQYSAPTAAQVLQQVTSSKTNQDEPYEISAGDVKQDSRFLGAEARVIKSCSDPPCNLGESMMQNRKSITQLQGSVAAAASIAAKVSEMMQPNTADHMRFTLAQHPALGYHVDTTIIDGTMLDSVPATSTIGKMEQAQRMERSGVGPVSSLAAELRRRKPSLQLMPPSGVCEEKSLLGSAKDDSRREGMNKDEHDPEKVVQSRYKVKVQHLCAQDPAQTSEHNIKFNPTSTLIAHANRKNNSGLSAKGDESVALAEEKEDNRTGQCEGTEIRGQLVLGDSNPESRGRPFVSFALPHGSNADGHSKPGISRPSSMYGSPQKRRRNGNHIEKQARESHTSYRIASNGTPSKRRRLDTNVDIRIIDVLNQIHETIINNIVDKFGGVRRDIYATQTRILEGTCDDFLTMRAKSIEHYDQLVDLANEYAMHRLGITDALSSLLDAELDVIDGIGGIIHYHDRLSLSSRFPDMVSPAIPDSFCVDQ